VSELEIDTTNLDFEKIKIYKSSESLPQPNFENAEVQINNPSSSSQLESRNKLQKLNNKYK
jgi:hypothetical protein